MMTGHVAEAGAVIHRDAAFGDQQRNNGADAAGEQRHADVELGEDSDEDGRREHGEHLLKTEVQHGADGWLVLGQVAEGGFVGFDCHWKMLLCAVVDEVDKNEGQRKGGRGSAGLPEVVAWRGVSSSGITRDRVQVSSVRRTDDYLFQHRILAEVAGRCPMCASRDQIAARSRRVAGRPAGRSAEQRKVQRPGHPKRRRNQEIGLRRLEPISHVPPKAANETITSRTK